MHAHNYIRQTDPSTDGDRPTTPVRRAARGSLGVLRCLGCGCGCGCGPVLGPVLDVVLDAVLDAVLARAAPGNWVIWLSQPDDTRQVALVVQDRYGKICRQFG